MQIIFTAILALIISGLISFLSTPLVINLSWRFKLIDDPRNKSHPKILHKKPTPRGGGLAILLAVFFTSLFFLPLDFHLIGILSGAITLVVMGLFDDRFDLSPYLRLLIQFLAAGMPIIAGIGISYLTNPFGGILDLSQPQLNFFFLGETRSIWLLSDLFAIFWIVTLMNFLNMGAKGVDGQLTGVVGIAALSIAMLSLKYSADIAEWPVIILAAITAGSYLGFLPWHFEPQKIMPSFSGSNLAGYLLGVLSILTTTKVGTLALVLAVPLIDTTYLVTKRLLDGKSPLRGDRSHLHHRLLDLGLTKRRVAYFYWIATLTLGVVAIISDTNLKIALIVLVGTCLFLFLLWINLVKKPSLS